ncbi:hypothetical protein B4099_0392 [Heyndrickxia coagulans]|uniref:Uncharacterized protein n=1 Tax=Heyndrickxia coagulans TaxID=1398 RepID=A0A150KFQ5_HEYCO|nr:hypothetical protein B4099_0392 [Heyndrickxia coagulans]
MFQYQGHDSPPLFVLTQTSRKGFKKFLSSPLMIHTFKKQQPFQWLAAAPLVDAFLQFSS